MLLSIVKYVQGVSHFHNPVKIVYQVTQLGLMQWYLQDPTLTHAMLLMFFYSLQNSRKVATSLCLQASLLSCHKDQPKSHGMSAVFLKDYRRLFRAQERRKECHTPK